MYLTELLLLKSTSLHRDVCWALSPALEMWKVENTVPQGAVEWGNQTRKHRNYYTTWQKDKYGQRREVEQKREWLTSFWGWERLPRWGCWARLWRDITKAGFQWKAGNQREGWSGCQLCRVCPASWYQCADLWCSVSETADRAQNWDPSWSVSTRKYGTSRKKMASS